MSKLDDKQCPVSVCLQNLNQTEKLASVNNLPKSGGHFSQPWLFVMPASAQRPLPSHDQSVLVTSSDPPLTVRFCSFQI
ncbi:MAG TPA: hypothetical protein VK138_04325 [Acidiferrobacterales bacterium]|nr:hypothetical protein [Acidiferrobacterales bacterium]